MSKLDRVIKQLEQGKELCGICGKDVTGAPECMHSDYKGSHSGSILAHITSAPASKEAHSTWNYHTYTPVYEESLYSMRIGEEMLLYSDEEIKALPMFDMPSKYAFSQVFTEVMRMADKIDRFVLNKGSSVDINSLKGGW